METLDAIVVGAGLSGLACAFELARGGASVATLERNDRAGGVVGTLSIDGFRFETGPNTVQAASEEFRRLCGDLGIDRRLVLSRPGARERYLWLGGRLGGKLGGRLAPLPNSIAGFLSTPILSMSGKLSVASELVRRFRAPANGVEPDLRAFFTERLGAEAANRLAGAFVRGVYAAELEELGAESAFPRMWKACVEHGGLVRGVLAARRRRPPELPGPRGASLDLLSFPDGLRELVDALAHVAGTGLVLGQEVTGLARDNRLWWVSTANGFALAAEHVILACPAPIAARILSRSGILPEAAAALDRITHARITLVHLGFEERELPGFPSGFGFLVPPDSPSSDAPRALGTIFGSNLFERRAPPGCIAVTSFYRTDTVKGWPVGGIAAEAAADLQRALRLRVPPRVRLSSVVGWDGVIPRYAPGHRARIGALEAELAVAGPGLHLAGCYTDGVSVEQVIARGRFVARRILSEGVVA